MNIQTLKNIGIFFVKTTFAASIFQGVNKVVGKITTADKMSYNKMIENLERDVNANPNT